MKISATPPFVNRIGVTTMVIKVKTEQHTNWEPSIHSQIKHCAVRQTARFASPPDHSIASHNTLYEPLCLEVKSDAVTTVTAQGFFP